MGSFLAYTIPFLNSLDAPGSLCFLFLSRLTTCRVRSRADAWGIVLYIWPSISLSWDTMGAKSCRRVFTDFSKMAHTACETSKTEMCGPQTQRSDWTWLGVSTYLHDLRVIQPLAQNLLYEGKNLLQNDHHLKTQETMWREHSHWKSKEKW